MPRVPTIALLSVLALYPAAGPTPLAAQARPDISGTWLMDPTRSESVAQAADASPREPIRLVITQSPTALRVQRTFDGKTQTVDYELDARDSREAVGTSGSPAAPSHNPNDAGQIPVDKAQARWIDSKLSTTTVYRVNGMATTKVETYDISADGQELHVLNELKMEHGYESNDGKGPQGYTAARDVYKRAVAR